MLLVSVAKKVMVFVLAFTVVRLLRPPVCVIACTAQLSDATAAPNSSVPVHCPVVIGRIALLGQAEMM